MIHLLSKKLSGYSVFGGLSKGLLSDNTLSTFAEGFPGLSMALTSLQGLSHCILETIS